MIQKINPPVNIHFFDKKIDKSLDFSFNENLQAERKISTSIDDSEIKETIFSHPEFNAYSELLEKTYTIWKDKIYNALTDINTETNTYTGNKYSWLPSEFEITSTNRTIIKSYINNLDENKYKYYSYE